MQSLDFGFNFPSYLRYLNKKNTKLIYGWTVVVQTYSEIELVTTLDIVLVSLVNLKEKSPQ